MAVDNATQLPGGGGEVVVDNQVVVLVVMVYFLHRGLHPLPDNFIRVLLPLAQAQLELGVK